MSESAASALQSPLIMVSVSGPVLEILLFVPRFTLAWVRLSSPSGLVRSWLRRHR